MSRWIDHFENHSFQSPWKNILEKIDKLEISNETAKTEIKELARLKKVIKFLDELIKAVDPELIPSNVWDSFSNQASACLQQMGGFEQNKNIQHIQSANNHADNLLSYVKPYIVSGKGAAQAAGSAYRAYSKNVDKNIDELAAKTTKVVQLIEENKNKTTNILNEVNQSKNYIKTFEDELLNGTEEEASLDYRLNTLMNKATEQHKKIEEYHQKLTSGNEEESAIIFDIDRAREDSLKKSGEIDAELKTSKALIQELTKFHQRVFGAQDRNGNKQGGLANELNQRRRELDQFKNDQQERYLSLVSEIESLLPGATSAGLAKAYSELKLSFVKPIRNASIVFYLSTLCLFIVAYFTTTDHFYWIDHVIERSSNKSDNLLNNVINNLPFYIPFLWLAIYSTKRRSENHRLMQEYAHKEALAKSYHGFKQQVESLKTEDDSLKEQLLEQAIKAISFNASNTLDGKHGEKLPLIETLDSIAKKRA